MTNILRASVQRLLLSSLIVYAVLTILVNVHIDSIYVDKAAEFNRPREKLATEPTVSIDNITHEIAGLSCQKYGGPSDEIASEMIYWENIPSDANYTSPFLKLDQVQYMTFEVDNAGFNNVRMGFETVVAIAIATGRTLVLPAAEELCHLRVRKGHDGSTQRSAFSFHDFFHIDLISREHPGLNIITMEQFLTREGMAGTLTDEQGQVLFPPHNRTNWDGANHDTIQFELEYYLRKVGTISTWNPDNCVAAFPKSRGPKHIQELKDVMSLIEKEGGFPNNEMYIGHPVPVDAPAKDRLKEGWANRKALCIYDSRLQELPLIHFTAGPNTDFPTRSDKIKELFGLKIPRPNVKIMDSGERILVHFYAFLFFEDWRQDLWMKRFIRDHLRYSDEIQCAAARVVHAIREKVKSDTNHHGNFDSFHIRRGDFRSFVEFEAATVLTMSLSEIKQGSTVYIATDETNRTFFQQIAKQYNLLFLDDFKHLLVGYNTNMHGMLDQLVAARGQIFFGCRFSTFSGYIHRLKGYFANKQKTPGFENGVVSSSYYYAPEGSKYQMQRYWPVTKPFFAREFPTSWRLLDYGVLQHEGV